MEMTTQVFTAMAMDLWTPGLDHHLFVKFIIVTMLLYERINIWINCFKHYIVFIDPEVGRSGKFPSSPI